MAQQILNLDELASLEHRYQSQLPAAELMRRAGLVIADRVCESLEPGNMSSSSAAPATTAATVLPPLDCCLIANTA